LRRQTEQWREQQFVKATAKANPGITAIRVDAEYGSSSSYRRGQGKAILFSVTCVLAIAVRGVLGFIASDIEV
jgi:hypothetical protein